MNKNPSYDSKLNMFIEAATEGTGPVCYSDDKGYELAKSFCDIRNKLASYACYELSLYINGKVPDDIEDEIITISAEKVLNNIAKFTSEERSKNIYCRKAYIKRIAKLTIIDYWRQEYRLKSTEESLTNNDDCSKGPTISYSPEIDSFLVSSAPYSEYPSSEASFSSYSFDDSEEYLYKRALLVSQIHHLFRIDKPVYKLMLYLYKAFVLSELETVTGGLSTVDSSGNDIGALAQLEGRTLGSIYDDLPYVIETYLNTESHLTEWEIHLIMDPLKEKLENYGAIVETYSSIFHYERIKRAIEDMSRIKHTLMKMKPIIYSFAEQIYSKLSNNFVT